jgi:hypothetical protein
MRALTTSARSGSGVRVGLCISTVSAVWFVLTSLGNVAAADDLCSPPDTACITQAVENTVEDTQETAQQATQTVENQAAEAVDRVRQTVDDVLDPGDAPGGGSDPGGHAKDGAGPRHGGSTTSRTSNPGPIADVVRVPSALTRERSRLRTPGVDGPALPPGHPRPTETEPGAALPRIAVDLAVPLLLVLMCVLAFTAAQNRLDRRDPHLVLAPLGPDELRFE